MFRIASLPGVFELSFVRGAKVLLEETDFEDLSTAIFIDMNHLQAEFVLTELHRKAIWEKLIILSFCRRSMVQQDIVFGIGKGALSHFTPGVTQPRELTDFLQKVREERGLT